MRRLFQSTAMLLAVMATAGARGGEPAPVADAPRPMKIGIVNLQVVLQQLDERLHIDAKLEARRQRAVDDLNALREEVKALEQAVAYATLDDAELEKKKSDLKEKTQTLKAQYKVLGDALKEQKLRDTQMIYEKILGEVAKYAEAHGYDLILRGSNADLNKAEGPLELNYRIFERNVLYARKDADISDQIAALLNKQYADQKKEKQNEEK